VAVWNARSGGIEGQRYGADGTALGAKFNVPGTGFPGLFSVGPDGSMVVLLTSMPNPGNYAGSLAARRLAADGTPQGAEISVATRANFFSSVALGPQGRFFVAWTTEDSNQVRGRLFAP
jgi:hypothetical protein